MSEHPTATWAAQQVVEAFPDETAPRWLHRDRDSVYSESFQQRVAGLGIAEVVSAPASPWRNPYVERLIGTIRRECLDHMIVLNARHLRHVLTIYSRYYHRGLTNLGQEKDAPDSRPISPPSGWIDHRDSGSRRTASPLRTAGGVSGLDLPRAWRSGTVGAPIAQLASSTVTIRVKLPSKERDLTA